MRPSETEIDDSRLLMDVARAVLAREEARAWTVEPGDFWCLLTPPGHRSAGQGWKLHLSATQLSAPVVLARAAEVLVRDGCAFKFARGLEQLGMLLSANCDRGGGGKFITVYPDGDEQFRRLAAELDRVTAGLPGPVVLSDRPLRPGSLVHYRYGVFAAEPVLTNDGSFESMVVGPDGERRKDERLAWYDPPPWARPPLPEPEAPSGVPEAVLVGDRFEVREAVRQSYRGGVYSGTDRRTGGDVVLKQARPHVLGLLDGTDARDRLRHEADMLDRLGPLGFTPRKVTMVTQQDNLFLVQERVPGVTLREWATREPAAEDVIEKAGQLVEIVAAVHEQGLVLRDLNPNNLMVTPEGRVRLIDLELVVPEGSRAYRAYTQGYAAPEQVSAAAIGPAPTRRADLFGLGATLVYLATAVDPLLAPDEPADRRGEGRLAEFVGLLGADMPVLRRLSPLVLGLTKDDPEQRWTLSRAREFLAADPAEVVNTFSPPIDRLITDGLRHILRTMDPRGARLWTTDEFGAATDPLNVQHGAGGVLSVLTRGAQVLGQAELLAGVADVAGWMRPRLSGIPRLLPGLYFGRSGTAWALYDAARLLGDEETAAQAVELAKKVPVRWPNHDICHGATGAGLLQLHLWRSTGDPELMDRFTQAADGVLEAAREREDGLLVWPIPKTFDTTLAGLVHYGFAHGVAGAGTFMLYAGLATGRAEYLEAARRAAETVAAVAITEGDAAWWPSGELADEADDRLRHWCSGASGAGTFLIRSWAVTGRQRHRELAEAAATAIRRGRWHSGVSSCHGLSGDGDFLLDLAEFTGDRRYRDWAADLATAMYARNTLRDGLMVLPDDSGVAVHTGYNTGLGGAVSFLLRLRHGGPRPWMLDELLLDRALRAPHGRLVHAGRSMTAVSEGR
ncbi:Serine/threonine protein kinase [Nonomuraea solani]|uniref:non-specific serine/threonine protein kinase n=1 Tax=Nonomuraea solani TaxID=1144553 RepID=A0A1H5WDL6_9ACTN|nr:class IV lanthionine synthetase LanL [Nonomuraea solani]SEF97473.1 Serine/threonine protein kinase [Nonomuraea solani]